MKALPSSDKYDTYPYVEKEIIIEKLFRILAHEPQVFCNPNSDKA